MKTVKVTDFPYLAQGDGITNDRNAIQTAIDDVFHMGGGVVTLPERKIFLTGNLVLRSNVTLYFEEGAVLLQSSNLHDYVIPTAEGYVPYIPVQGHDVVSNLAEWDHAWHNNYPLVYGPEGAEHIKIKGKGIFHMMDGTGCHDIIHVCPIGFYRVNDFEISDITIENYSTYAVMPYTCTNGLIQNIVVKDIHCGNCDGISVMNGQNIRITGCHLETGDDAIYIWSSYRDPRGRTWWSSEVPQPSMNIEIDHNYCDAGPVCKAFGMILWGTEAPDLEQIEVSNVYIHDNYFRTMGIWRFNPYTTVDKVVPVKNIRFENNKIDEIQESFPTTNICNMTGYPSMKNMLNGDFMYAGAGFWSMQKNANPDSVGVKREMTAQGEFRYGYLSHLEEGEVKLYQGLCLESNQIYTLHARVKTSGVSGCLFVRDSETDKVIAAKEFQNMEWETISLEFTAPETGNYRLGIESGKATIGWVNVDFMELEHK